MRKCLNNYKQLNECQKKFDFFLETNKNLKMMHREFKDLFDNHLNICILNDKLKRKMVPYPKTDCPICKGLRKND